MTTGFETEERKIVDMVASIVKLAPDKIATTDRFREDLGMDSLASLELLSRMSDEFDVNLELEDAMRVVTIEQAAALIAQVVRQEQART